LKAAVLVKLKRGAAHSITDTFDDGPTPTGPATPLVTAAETNYFDTSVEFGHEDDACRHLAMSLYIRQHQFSENDIGTYIMPLQVVKQQSVKKEWDRRAIMRLQTNFQSAIMKFYQVALTELVTSFKGLRVWRSASPTQQMGIFLL